MRPNLYQHQPTTRTICSRCLWVLMIGSVRLNETTERGCTTDYSVFAAVCAAVLCADVRVHARDTTWIKHGYYFRIFHVCTGLDISNSSDKNVHSENGGYIEPYPHEKASFTIVSLKAPRTRRIHFMKNQTRIHTCSISKRRILNHQKSYKVHMHTSKVPIRGRALRKSTSPDGIDFIHKNHARLVILSNEHDEWSMTKP